MRSLIIRLNKKTVASFFFSVVVLLTVGALAIAYGEENTLPAAGGRQTVDEADRIRFLEQYGWSVAADGKEQAAVTLPQVLDETLQNYNRLQVEQGFNLEAYCGKTLTRYTYRIENFPTGEKDVVANLYQYENTIVAGDVSYTRLGGFLQGLAFPETSDS